MKLVASYKDGQSNEENNKNFSGFFHSFGSK